MQRSTKRVREDQRQLSKDEYDYEESNLLGNSEPIGRFQIAPISELKSRRMVRSRKQTFDAHVMALNKHFHDTLKSQLKHDPCGNWTINMAEYKSHSRNITQRYGAEKGMVLTFGKLTHGDDNNKEMLVKFPRIVAGLNTIHVTKIACGGSHTCAITALGQLFTWGKNDNGALGRDGKENMPSCVTGFPERTSINQVVAGDNHTVVLTVEGSVFAFGSYIAKDGTNWSDATCAQDIQRTPFCLKAIESIVDLKCGNAFNLALGSDGRVWSWGLCEFGQLGRPLAAPLQASQSYNEETVYAQQLTPGEMVLMGKKLPVAKAIGCGAYHSLVSLTSVGTLYTCGLNDYGQLGIGSIENQSSLSLVSGLSHENIIQLDGGVSHSVVLTAQSKLFTFGRGDSGQLGLDEKIDPGFYKDTPTVVHLSAYSIKEERDNITMISCGSNHSIVLARDTNAIYSWGSGDKFQLGHGSMSNEKVPRRLSWSKTSFDSAQILQVDAGGQHSATLAISKEEFHQNE